MKAGKTAEPAWHLASSPKEAAFTEFQHATVCFAEAFYRYVGKSFSLIANHQNLTGPESILLHAIYARNRPKSMAELQHFTNRTDLANIQYSIRKLIERGFIEMAPKGKGRATSYQITARGREIADRFVEARRDLLNQFPGPDAPLLEQLESAKKLMVVLTGLYDQASRNLTTQI